MVFKIEECFRIDFWMCLADCDQSVSLITMEVTRNSMLSVSPLQLRFFFSVIDLLVS